MFVLLFLHLPTHLLALVSAKSYDGAGSVHVSFALGGLCHWPRVSALSGKAGLRSALGSFGVCQLYT